MNRKWKRGWGRFLVIAAICVCTVGSVAWADTQKGTSEEEAVKEAFIGSQNTMAQIGAFESSNGKTDLLSEEEIQADLAAFDAQMDRYYAKDNGCR